MEGVQDVVKPTCRIEGTEQNIYALVGYVSVALRDAGLEDRAKEFVHRSIPLDTYDQILGLSQDYVEFEAGA